MVSLCVMLVYNGVHVWLPPCYQQGVCCPLYEQARYTKPDSVYGMWNGIPTFRYMCKLVYKMYHYAKVNKYFI